jgi:hypothetical protein
MELLTGHQITRQAYTVDRVAIDHCYVNELTNPQMTYLSHQLKMGVNEASY